MAKAPKKVKSSKVPKPIKVKKEKSDEDKILHSMSHYMGDRLELIKQVFGSLKPKTIKNLAPNYLKESTMDELQQLCLDELMCISTKRLRAIINGTECPTDTESSPDDSDVEHQEEHVSLEEISSESEAESRADGGKKKKPNRIITPDNTGKNTEVNNPSGNGQISVLELLELQARARAIRSQLALEPVTKIEVNEEDDAESTGAEVSNGTALSSSSTTSHKRKISENGRSRTVSEKSDSQAPTSHKSHKQNGSKQPNTATTDETTIKGASGSISNGNAEVASEATTSKRIKLKRHYRNVKSKENPAPAKTTEEEEAEDSKHKRADSPEVIPVVKEPETYVITDSSDEEGRQQSATKNKSTKQTGDLAEGKVEADQASMEQKQFKEPTSEQEEGEISDAEMEQDEATAKLQEMKQKEIESGKFQKSPEKGSSAELGQDFEQDQVPEQENHAEVSTLDKEQESNGKDEMVKMAVPAPSPKCSQSSNPEEEGGYSERPTPSNAQYSGSEAIEDDDIANDNDDCISIGGDELELSEGEDNTCASTSMDGGNGVRCSPKDMGVISLDSSESESNAENDGDCNGEGGSDNRQTSWRLRYLKSNKVNKVLLASRLGKRVRDKLKDSKKDSNKSNEQESSTDVPQGPQFQSQFEDGSVEQYKELLELNSNCNTNNAQS